MGAINTNDSTVPDPDEQNALAHVDEAPAKAVDPAKKKSVFTWLALFLIIIVLMHLGR